MVKNQQNAPAIIGLPGIVTQQFPQILWDGNQTHLPCGLDNSNRFSTFLLFFFHESMSQISPEGELSGPALWGPTDILVRFQDICSASDAASWHVVYCLKATEITFKMVYNLYG